MINLLSIVETPLILHGMTLGLGAFIKDRRQQLGMTQTELADCSDLTKSHLSAIESGKIALPSADIRRRLAKALGVSPLDLLVAAGEITEEEVREAGVSPIARLDPRRQRIVEQLVALPSLDAYLTALEDVLNAFVQYGVQPRESVDEKPDDLNDAGVGV